MQWLLEHPWILAVLIFLARVTDVSMSTVRTILVFRSYRFLAAAIGFVEVLVWLLAVTQVMRHLDHWYLALAYAAGFSTGNVVGIWLERKLAVGSELVRAISEDLGVRLADSLRRNGYPVTEIQGVGDKGQVVEVCLVTERRRRVPRLLEVIHGIDPAAVVTISDVRRHDHRAQPIRVPEAVTLGKMKRR